MFNDSRCSSAEAMVGNHTPREIHTDNDPVVQTEVGQARLSDQALSLLNRGS
jgi:hypothetical protein